MAESAAWADLPKEIINLISERIDDTEFDLVHFRSVCSTWRSSSIPIPPKVLLKFPLLSFPDIHHDLSDIVNSPETPFLYLSKRSFLLIKPPQQQQQHQRPWLIQVARNTRGKIKLLHPIITYQSSSPYLCSLPVLDFNKFPVVQLGTDFIVQKYRSFLTVPDKMLAVSHRGEKPRLLGILSSSLDQRVIHRCHSKKWTVISHTVKNGDICVFKGRFYAVDKTGRTVTVEPDSSVELVEDPMIDGNKKLLVESNGELWMVNIYDYLWFGVVVFKLDEERKKWVKLNSLGDRVLFFGKGYSFSASASDLCVDKGNCVIFVDDDFLSFHDRQHGKCVYHLDQRELLSDFAKYFNLFSRPEWIVKS